MGPMAHPPPLPCHPQSFFHTVLENSPACESLVGQQPAGHQLEPQAGLQVPVQAHRGLGAVARPNDFKPQDFLRLQSFPGPPVSGP